MMESLTLSLDLEHPSPTPNTHLTLNTTLQTLNPTLTHSYYPFSRFGERSCAQDLQEFVSWLSGENLKTGKKKKKMKKKAKAGSCLAAMTS